MNVTDRQQEAIEAIRKGITGPTELGEALGTSTSAASAMLKRLEENGLIERGDNNVITLTSDAGQGSNQGGQGRAPDPNSKMSKARELMQQVGTSKGRKQILEMFVQKLGLTPAGASTYYQNLRGELGMASQNARGVASNSRQNTGGRGGQRSGGQRGRASGGTSSNRSNGSDKTGRAGRSGRNSNR